MEADIFNTIATLSQGEYKEKGSKFPSYIFPIESVEEFEMQLEHIKKEHFKARHHCYAYRLGFEGEVFRQNDDGEPSGTAGKPMLGQLIKHDLTFVGAVVVRYFGGTKLGTSGLIKAYKEATIGAIAEGSIISKIRTADINISFDYSQMGKVMQILKDLKQDIHITAFDANPNLIIRVPFSEQESKSLEFIAKYMNRAVEDVTLKEKLEDCVVEIIE